MSTALYSLLSAVLTQTPGILNVPYDVAFLWGLQNVSLKKTWTTWCKISSNLKPFQKFTQPTLTVLKAMQKLGNQINSSKPIKMIERSKEKKNVKSYHLVYVNFVYLAVWSMPFLTLDYFTTRPLNFQVKVNVTEIHNLIEIRM